MLEIPNPDAAATLILLVLSCKLAMSEITLFSHASTLFPRNLNHRLADWCAASSLLPLLMASENCQQPCLSGDILRRIGLTWGLCSMLWKCVCLDSISNGSSQVLLCLIMLLKLVDYLVHASFISSINAVYIVSLLQAVVLVFATFSFNLQCPKSIDGRSPNLSCVKTVVCFAFLLALMSDGLLVVKPELSFDLSWLNLTLYAHLIAIVCVHSCANFTLITAADTIQRISTITGEMNSRKTFVRYISHEVRSPLSTSSLGLDCLLQLLQEESADRQELLDLATDCKSATQSAIQTLSDLLLFDKIESNMMQLDTAAVDFGAFLQQVVRPLERQVQLTGLQWRSEVDEAVCGAMVQMDRYKMEQVVRNFINNALKFTPAGGRISLTVGVFTSARDASAVEADALGKAGSGAETGGQFMARTNVQSRVRVEVADTGHGIAPQQLGSLFGQYVQIDAGKLQKGGGSGLGLWLSKAIVEAHGGRVGVHSDGEGKGATFFFEIPILSLGVVSGKKDFALPATESVCDDDSTTSTTMSTFSSPSSSSSSSTSAPYSNFHTSNSLHLRFGVADTRITRASVGNVIKPDDLEGRISLESASLTSTLDGAQLSQDSCEMDLNLEHKSRSDGEATNFSARLDYSPGLLSMEHPGMIRRGPEDGYPLSWVSSSNAQTTISLQQRSAAIQREQFDDVPIVSYRILLADDSALARKLMHRVLVTLGKGASKSCQAHYVFDIQLAATGQAAYDMVARSLKDGAAYDLVLIDFYMPALNGAQAVCLMRAAGFSNAIVAVTSCTCEDDLATLSKSGVNYILEKPFTMKKFSKLFRKYVIDRSNLNSC